MLELFINTVTEGLIYAILVCGIYITYRILDFPDLTVDGSFPLGAAITAVMISNGVNPLLTLPVSVFMGSLAGLVTGIIHVKFKVRDLLAGIITNTALFSINLQIAGANLSLLGMDTIFTKAPLGMISLTYKKFIVALVITLIIKLVLDFYFKTKNGLLLRAVGDNESFVTTLAKDSGRCKILGLVIANALVSLSGCIVCQQQRAFSSTMGTGQMVFGLAAVLIGITIFKKLSFVKGTTCAIIGSVVYKICVQIAIQLGLEANLLKLVTAVLFFAILVIGNYQKKAGKHA